MLILSIGTLGVLKMALGLSNFTIQIAMEWAQLNLVMTRTVAQSLLSMTAPLG